MQICITDTSNKDIEIVKGSEEHPNMDGFVGNDTSVLLCFTRRSMVTPSDQSSFTSTIPLDGEAHMEWDALAIVSKLLPIIKYLEGLTWF